MPEYLSPGVYVEEIEIGAKPIEGVGTSTAGFLGEAERGPTTLQLVCGMSQFKRLYGEHFSKQDPSSLSASYLYYAVEGFFINGGKRCFINRIVGKNNKTSEYALPATSQDSGGGPAPIIPAFKITQKTLDELKNKGESQETLSKLESIKDELFSSENLFTSKLKTIIKDNDEFKLLKSKILKLAKADTATKGAQPSAVSDQAIMIRAVGPGSWGDRIGIKIDKANFSNQDDPKLKKLFRLVVFYWKKPLPDKSNIVDPTDTGTVGELNRIVPDIIEDYNNVSSDPASADYFKTIINNRSNLIRVDHVYENFAPTISDTARIVLLQGGDDGDAPMVSDYKGSDDGPGKRTGLTAFNEIDEISIINAPVNFSDPSDHQELCNILINHCELKLDRFAILQSQHKYNDIANFWPPRDSQYAAMYYPWLKIKDPVTNQEKEIPPGGHIAGIYARTDVERGVHKAPANAVVKGIIGVEFPISKGEQDILNPRGINCIRYFQGRDFRVWGARTISSDPLWKYVNVRRLFMAIEESIDQGTQWIVFEPNHQLLWDRVRQSVSDYLTRVWKDGALMGRTPDEAFFVKCDETTMEANDLENGRLVVLIGIAPVKPAEFVIFRIAQSRAGSEILE